MQLPNVHRQAPSLLPVIAAGIAILLLAGILVILPPLFGAAIVFGTIATTLIVIYPEWGFYLLLLSLPIQDIGAVGEFTATNAIFGLTVLAWLLRRLVMGGQPLPRSAVGPFFIIFVVGLVLSLTVAQEFEPAIAALFQWIKALFVYFIALDLLRTRQQVRNALIMLFLAGAIEAAIGLVQYTTGAGPESFAIGDQFSRAYGTFGRPNSYAGYLEMLLPPAAIICWWFWHHRPPAEPWRYRLARVAGLSAAGLIGLAVLASFSRGAWLGTIGGIAVMVLLTSSRARVFALVTGAIGGAFLLLGGAQFLPGSVQTRLDSIIGSADTPDVRTAFITADNFAVVERLAHWEAGKAMFASNPLLGVGLGNFNVRYAEFTISPTFLISQGHAHNYYIHVAAEAGLFGLIPYLLLLLSIIITAIIAIQRTANHPLGRALVIASCGTITAVMIHNMFENLHVLSMGVQLSTIWAFLTIAAQPYWQASAAADRNEAQ